MKKLNVSRTRELDLCVSCEICKAICPKDAIMMEYKFGQFLPKVDYEKCIECSLCLELCPGIDIYPLELRDKDNLNNIIHSHYLECYTAYSNDPKIRKNSTSGGLITNLAIELIKDKKFSEVFVLDFNNFNMQSAKLKPTSNINKIFNSAKSKYIPASVYEIIKNLKREDQKKYIIIGTPCLLYGIKKFIKKYKIPEKNLLFLGLFCSSTLNFNILRYFEDNYAKLNEKMIKFQYRTKEKYGWPGHSKIYFDSGRSEIIDRTVRMRLKRYFTLNRCLFCFNKLNRLADISCGDCYIKKKSSINGKSTVIVRTKKGKEIFEKYAYLFALEKETIEEIRKSQNIMRKKDNLIYAKIFAKKKKIYLENNLNYKVNTKAHKRLLKLQKYIKWGKYYKFNKIKFNFFLSNVFSRFKAIINIIIKKARYYLLPLYLFFEGFLIYKKKRKTLFEKKRTNIVIFSGNFFNEGSQAMTLIVVDHLKKKFPKKKFYHFSYSYTDFEKSQKEKNKYKINLLPWTIDIKLKHLIPFRLFIKDSKYNYLINKTRVVIKKANFIIDLSGYALSSQWGRTGWIKYLLNLIIAKKYSVPYYIFPQSIGPFDYPMKYKIFLYPLLNWYLKYPEKIFVREMEGFRDLLRFTKGNIEKSYDIVLQHDWCNLFNIFNKNVKLKTIDIKPNSVGIIPNVRVIERADPNEIYLMYHSIIKNLIDAKKIIYILWHSQKDLIICKKIKNLFPENKSVKIMDENLNSIELENIIKKFDFVIASRYHSIVQAYKNNVPGIVIGWAVKYYELLREFDQLYYHFDIRKNLNLDEIIKRLDKMIENFRNESKKIKNKMNVIKKKKSPFDIFNN